MQQQMQQIKIVSTEIERTFPFEVDPKHVYIWSMHLCINNVSFIVHWDTKHARLFVLWINHIAAIP